MTPCENPISIMCRIPYEIPRLVLVLGFSLHFLYQHHLGLKACPGLLKRLNRSMVLFCGSLHTLTLVHRASCFACWSNRSRETRSPRVFAKAGLGSIALRESRLRILHKSLNNGVGIVRAP